MGFALTFDDGPGPSMPALLDVLEQASCRATFFVLGCNLDQPEWTQPPGDGATARAMVIRAIRDGHEVANHSYSHAHADRIAPDVFMSEVDRMDDVLRELRRTAGADPDARMLVRLPYGEQANDRRAAALRAAGREPIGWTGELYSDWVAQDPGELCARLVDHVAACEREGRTAVLTLHISGESEAIGFARPWTVEAVRRFLVAAAGNGWPSVACPAA